jgi:UDP-glucuronate 4-epimerase
MTDRNSTSTFTTFITGAGGFVGLALSELLVARGETVIGFDRQALPFAARATFDTLPGRFVMIEGDVCDADAVLQAMRAHRPQRVVTLAAITANAARERRTPAAIFAVNVGGVLNAISAAADCDVRRIVHASSGSVYGASGRQAAPLDEVETPLLPEGLYGMSKAAAESAALRLASLHRLDLVVGRLGTCFGPWETDQRGDQHEDQSGGQSSGKNIDRPNDASARQHTDRIGGSRDTPSAPLQVLQCLNHPAGAIAVLPRPSRRDWLYVRDAAAGLAALLDKPLLPSPIYNVSTGFIWSMQAWCAAVQARHPLFQWKMAADVAADASGNVSTEAAADVAAPTIDLFGSYDRAPLNISRLMADTDYVPRYDLTAAASDFLDWHARAGMPAIDH